MSITRVSRRGTACFTLLAIVAAIALALLPTGATGAVAAYLTIGTTTDTTINVSWFSTGLTGVSEYRVYYGYSVSSMTNCIKCPASVATTTITGLMPKVLYYVKVRAYTSATSYVESAVRTASTQAGAPTLPSAPSGLTATAAGQNKITVTWKDNSLNESGFKVERSTSATGPFTPLTSTVAGATGYSDTSCSASTTYYYRVCSYNSAGLSAYSNIANATTAAAPPTAPSALTGTLIAKGQIRLGWSDNSSNETSFRLERSVSQTTGFAQIALVAAGATSYTDITVGTSSTYYYRVLATNSGGNSGYSNVAAVSTIMPAPTAPSGLAAVALSSSQISLQWSDNSGTETGFGIQRSASSAGPFTSIAQVAANSTSWTDSSVIAGTTYYYKVYATGQSSNSGYSNPAFATPPVPQPADPSNLLASAVSPSQINITWSDNSANEQGFDIYRSVGTSDSFSLLAKAAANTKVYSDKGLAGSTTYYYQVRAYNAGGPSRWTNTAQATTGTTPPSAPTGLKAATSASRNVDLQWIDTSSDETGFTVERGTAGVFAVIASLSPGAVSYTDTTVSPGTSYSYRVASFNNGGSSAYSNILSVTTPIEPPAAPSGLTATAISANQIRLDWADNADNETGFKVERSTSGASGSFLLVASPSASSSGSVAYTDSTCQAGTTYYYQVKAQNTAGDSGASAVAHATTSQTKPAAPTILSSSGLTTTSVSLSWTDNSNNEDWFVVEKSTASATGPFSTLTQTSANTKAASDTGLSPNTTYYYRVAAGNSAGISAYSDPLTVITRVAPPAAPSELTAVAVSTTEIDLSWTANSTNETGFKVERSTISETMGFNYVGSTNAGVKTYNDKGLAPATTYYYRVYAYNSAASDYSNTASDSTEAPAPAISTAPTDLTALAVSDKLIRLKWIDNSNNEDGFQIMRATGSDGQYAWIDTVSSNITSYDDTTVKSGSTYFYQVCAFGTDGTSCSTTASAAPLASVVVPAAPTQLQATATSDSEVALEWTYNSQPRPEGFIVECSRYIDSGFVEVARVVAADRECSISGLSEKTTYYIRICARNSNVKSDYTNTAQVTTKLKAPTDLNVGKVSCFELKLTWKNNSTRAVRNRVERSTDGVSWSVLVEQPITPGDLQTYSDTTCQPGQKYIYRVLAIGSISNPSSEATQTTSAWTITPDWWGGVPSVGPYCYNVCTLGDYAYGTTATGLQVLRKCGDLLMVTSTVRFAGCCGVAVMSSDDKRYAFVSQDCTVYAVDVTDPNHPIKLDVQQTMPSVVQDLCVSGTTLYAACGYDGVVKCDVSDIAHGMGHYVTEVEGTKVGFANTVAVSPSGEVVAGGTNGLFVSVDGIERGRLSIGDSVEDIDFLGDYAYLAAHSAGLVVVGISDGVPSVVGSWTMSVRKQAVGVCASPSDGAIYVTVSDPYMLENGIRKFTPGPTPQCSGFTRFEGQVDRGIGQLSDGSLVASAGTRGFYRVNGTGDVLSSIDYERDYGGTIAADADRLCVKTAGQLHVYDVSQPASIFQRAVYSTTADSITVAKLDGVNYAFLPEGQTIKKIDLDRDSVCAPLAIPSTVLCLGVCGQWVYACTDAGLVVIDHTKADPASAAVPVNGAPEAVRPIDSNGDGIADILLVLTGSCLQTFRVSADGRFATALGQVGVSNGRALAVSGNRAYIAAGYSGIVAVDISNPALPVISGCAATLGYAHDLGVFGDAVFVACAELGSNNGIQTFYGGSTGVPVPRTTSFLFSGSLNGPMAVFGNTIYCADSQSQCRIAQFEESPPAD